MVPLAILNGRAVSGCMSSTGRFEAGCRCWESTVDASPCRCHCARCASKTTCCCKPKSTYSHSLANESHRGNGVSGNHCKPAGFYEVTPAVSSSAQVTDNLASFDLAVAITDSRVIVARTTVEHVGVLNTGPPGNNLVVELHRFLI